MGYIIIALCHRHTNVGRKIQLSDLHHSQRYLKKAGLEDSLVALHSEEAASLTPSCYILLVESGLIDMTGSVLWPNRECSKLSVLLVINYGKSNQMLWIGQ